MTEIAINVSNVSKVYRLYERPMLRLKEALSIKKKKYHKDFSALHDVTFHVEKGEMLGIIGKNGAGKSTLLKIITGVLTQNSGTVEINGKISALLELGAGFNFEYTGIENIYLNGQMIGFTKEEMDAKIDDIVNFADIGDFVYQPVKTYSSGMFARLAFAVAINVEPDILIIDEALSVGDVFFQSKCYNKMQELKKSGKTILFVTHDMSSIMKYCNRAILINDGTKVAEGTPKEMIDLYKKVLVGQYDPKEDDLETLSEVLDGEKEEKVIQEGSWKSHMLVNPNFINYGDQRASIIDYGIFDENGRITNTIYKLDTFMIRMKVKFHTNIKNPIFAYSIKDLKGTELCGTNTMIEDQTLDEVKEGQIIELSFTQKMMLQGGQHLLQLGCTGFENENLVVYHRLYDICCIQVVTDKMTIGYCDLDSKVEYNL
ncbi:MAG TPA: ABC transporter ATP-binding protein [Candidatus Merdenecus merdavium]|nr:ABC transporter ATP-binding protein [Candidatus Merdenecus merdavium]